MDNILKVNGVAKLELKADWVIIKLEIISANIDYNIAIREANNKYNALQKKLGSIGFKEEDLKTNSLKIETLYESIEEKGVYKRIFSAYQVRYYLSLEFSFLASTLNNAIRAISESIAEPNLDVRFTMKEKAQYKSILIRKACDNAKEIATNIALTTNIRLGEIKNIEYNNQFYNFNSPTSFRPLYSMKEDVKINPEPIEINESLTIIWHVF